MRAVTPRQRSVLVYVGAQLSGAFPAEVVALRIGTWDTLDSLVARRLLVVRDGRVCLTNDARRVLGWR